MSNKNEDIYAQALEEFEGDNRNQGLYAKCFAEADGDENKAKARYIKSRADELTGSVTPKAPPVVEASSETESVIKVLLVPIIFIFFIPFYLIGIVSPGSLVSPRFLVSENSSADWIYGRWEENPISGINLTRWMEFRKDGTVEIGQLGKTTTNIQSYEVEGDLVIVDNSISDGFGFKLYYKKIDYGVLARATSSGAVESSDRYYKK